MALLSDFAPEILLEIFSHLTITSLLQARGVCSLWRDCVAQADIHPIRQHLLRLYSDLLQSNIFLDSRPHVKNVLQPFDRPAYLQALQRQLQAIGSPADLPEAFEIFILEWPALAAFDCIWPGLPYEWSEDDGASRRLGWNLLANIPPQLFQFEIVEHKLMPGHLGKRTTAALPIWESNNALINVWLVTDSQAPLFGRMLRTMDGPSYEGPFGLDPITWEKERGTPIPDEDREWTSEALEGSQLAFLDWLDVSFDRFNCCEGERYDSSVFYDKDLARWRNHSFRPPNFQLYKDNTNVPKGTVSKYIQTGGDMLRFVPITPPVAPLPAGRAQEIEDMDFRDGKYWPDIYRYHRPYDFPGNMI